MPDSANPLAYAAVPADPPAGGFSIRRRGEDLEACRRIIDDFEKAHLEEANSTGGPISITRRDLAKLRGDLDEAFRRQVDYAATFWSTTNDRIAAEDACLRGALKICIKQMCECCRADAAHSMPGKECVEGCETLRLVKKALGEEDADHAQPETQALPVLRRTGSRLSENFAIRRRAGKAPYRGPSAMFGLHGAGFRAREHGHSAVAIRGGRHTGQRGNPARRCRVEPPRGK